MNTLSRAVTGRFFVNDNGYQELEARWAALVNSSAKKELTAADFILYAFVRGKDWRKGCTAPKKAEPLWAGATHPALWHTLHQVGHALLHAGATAPCHAPTHFFRHFGDLLNGDAIQAAAKIIGTSHYKVSALGSDAYNTDAVAALGIVTA